MGITPQRPFLGGQSPGSDCPPHRRQAPQISLPELLPAPAGAGVWPHQAAAVTAIERYAGVTAACRGSSPEVGSDAAVGDPSASAATARGAASARCRCSRATTGPRGAGVAALSTDAVRDVVWRLAVVAGLTPHRFRAWFATHLVAETGDLAAVPDLLGRGSADTTRVYTRVAAQRQADVRRRAFAR